MADFFINQDGILYTGDIRPGDRFATEQEVAEYYEKLKEAENGLQDIGGGDSASGGLSHG